MQKLFLSLGMVAVLAACNNNDDKPGGSNTNYQPVTTGSTWTYSVKDNNTGATGSYILTATAKDTTHNGKTYRVFSNTGGPNEYYHVTSGNDYYQFGNFAAINQVIELLYLKGNASVTNTWQETRTVNLSGVNITVTFNFTIAEKGISYTVAGKTYNNVTRVNIVLAAPGVPIASQDINYYYAEGIGRIFSKVVLNVPLASIATNTETSLTNYTIVP